MGVSHHHRLAGLQHPSNGFRVHCSSQAEGSCFAPVGSSGRSTSGACNQLSRAASCLSEGKKDSVPSQRRDGSSSGEMGRKKSIQHLMLKPWSATVAPTEPPFHHGQPRMPTWRLTRACENLQPKAGREFLHLCRTSWVVGRICGAENAHQHVKLEVLRPRSLQRPSQQSSFTYAFSVQADVHDHAV